MNRTYFGVGLILRRYESITPFWQLINSNSMRTSNWFWPGPIYSLEGLSIRPIYMVPNSTQQPTQRNTYNKADDPHCQKHPWKINFNFFPTIFVAPWDVLTSSWRIYTINMLYVQYCTALNRFYGFLPWEQGLVLGAVWHTSPAEDFNLIIKNKGYLQYSHAKKIKKKKLHSF